jgi:hypothetical protein
MSRQTMPIASKATPAVIKTASNCGRRSFTRRGNGHTKAMINGEGDRTHHALHKR